jgi:hypothetical protein
MRLPYWHAKLDERSHDGRLATHCPVIDKPDPRLPAPGFVPCQPEALRNRAEKRVRALDLDFDTVSLDSYSIARVLRSEWATATVETKVAVAECIRNLAARLRTTPTKLILKNDHELGLYGRIPQGRDFDTALDPTAGDLCVAQFVLSGKSGSFARSGDSYTCPARLGPNAIRILSGWMQQNACVGPLPNVPLAHLIVFRHVGQAVSPEQKAVNDQALLELQMPSSLDAPTETDPHPRWGIVKAIGTAAGTGLLIFGIGAAVAEFTERPWKTWRER